MRMQLYIQDGKYAHFKRDLNRLVKQYGVRSQSELIVSLIEKEAKTASNCSQKEWIQSMCGATKSLDQELYQAMRREIIASRDIKNV